MPPKSPNGAGYLYDVRVLELADEQGEYAGKLLAGLGADVIKVEPPEGNSTRRIGPFLAGEPHPDRSLHFWHYNLGKRGVRLDLPSTQGRQRFLDLARECDVFLETTPKGYLDGLGITYDSLKAANPGLVWVRITPFGDDGPWGHFKGSDLVHLALGGVMMCTGYDRDPMTKRYDLPPIAPQMFQAYHVAGQHAVMGAIGALLYREATGRGQRLSVSVHETVSKNTEPDVPLWVYQRQPVFRQTCRHAAPTNSVRHLALAKNGRYVTAMTVAGTTRPDALIALLKKYGCADDLTSDQYQDPKYLARPEVNRHIVDVAHRFIVQCDNEETWHDAQAHGQVWAPVRKPEENLKDGHWKARDTFVEIDHPEVGKSFTYPGKPWVDERVPWRSGPRAPVSTDPEPVFAAPHLPRRREGTLPIGTSALGRPFAFNNVRIVDFTWWLASGGGPRFLSSLGAEVIKVEYKARWDLRYIMANMPDGGRAERDRATAPCPPKKPVVPSVTTPNAGGFFNDINPGKYGISLNMNHPKGKELLAGLIKSADVVAEGFSPEVMRKWGFGYEQMRAINPTIIYVQQSGMGQKGVYGKYRAVGPMAASLAGLTEMSGLPDPYPPVGIGYSYLDWFGAYNIATAMMAALYRREKTGQGTYIDASQVEVGIYLNGSAILNYTANGQPWRRYGNRSPWKPAAPSGAYRCAGDDRWTAITCFTEEEWRALCRVLGDPSWTHEPRFSTLERRLQAQDDLDRLMHTATESREAYRLMEELQAAGVPAGVCQTSGDRCDTDPQLRHLKWLTELDQTEMGRWPVKEFPVRFSETPAHMGGRTNRASPCYGEDNEHIYTEILGLTKTEIEGLKREDVI